MIHKSGWSCEQLYRERQLTLLHTACIDEFHYVALNEHMITGRLVSTAAHAITL